MRAPEFWSEDGLWPRLLAPAGLVYAAATARRLRRRGYVAPVPVICCGGVTAGGAGKTPLALDLVARLQARGRRVACLTRGHGGTARGVLRVEPGRHDATLAGDEALLLAALAPTFVAADRADAARAAVAAGAQMLVMDDGLQNPSLRQDCAILVVDGGSGFGNGRVIPAGPLREKVAIAAARCRAAVLIGDDLTGAAARLAATLPVLRARLVAEADPSLSGARVLAFAGIARPEKFFASAREAGAEPVDCVGFPDHHAFSTRELDRLLACAAAAGAVLITTAKDAVRLPPLYRDRVRVLRVHLEWERPTEIEHLLDTLP